MNFYKPLLPLAAAAAIGGGAGAVATTALHDDTPTVRTITNTRTVASSSSETPSLSPHSVYESAKDSVAYITTGSGTGSAVCRQNSGAGPRTICRPQSAPPVRRTGDSNAAYSSS